jgi:hypothetical protein
VVVIAEFEEWVEAVVAVLQSPPHGNMTVNGHGDLAG